MHLQLRNWIIRRSGAALTVFGEDDLGRQRKFAGIPDISVDPGTGKIAARISGGETVELVTTPADEAVAA